MNPLQAAQFLLLTTQLELQQRMIGLRIRITSFATSSRNRLVGQTSTKKMVGEELDQGKGHKGATPQPVQGPSSRRGSYRF